MLSAHVGRLFSNVNALSGHVGGLSGHVDGLSLNVDELSGKAGTLIDDVFPQSANINGLWTLILCCPALFYVVRHCFS